MKTQIIYGPPGTGKTYTLQKTVEAFEAPTLCVSFTRSAARELAERGVGASSSTLHSLAFKACDLTPSQVVNRDRLKELTNLCGVAFSAGEYDEYATAGDEYLSLISYADSTFKTYSEVSRHVSMGTVAEFLWFAKYYSGWKQGSYLWDFTDMIQYAGGDPKYIPGLRYPEIRGLVIDEAQDLSPLQWRMIDTVIRENKQLEKVWVAGDDDQAIFTWSGADPEGMQKFGDQYKAENVYLSQSWRVPAIVHSKAVSLIEKVRGRVDKTYHPREAQGHLTGVYNLRYADKYEVVLYRNHSIGKEIAKELKGHGIPYVGRNVRSPLTHPAARALIGYQRLVAGEALPGREVDRIRKYATLHYFNKALQEKIPGRQVIRMPGWLDRDLRQIETMNRSPLSKIKPVELSSIHQYKGKEKDRVLLIDGMNDRTREGMAFDKSAEYRVFYVGMTRAKETLGIYEWENPIGLRRL